MFGIDYLTVGGYLIDGGIVCRGCGEKRNLPASAALTVNDVETNFADDGLYCDDCTEEIVEPAPLADRLRADDEEEVS